MIIQNNNNKKLLPLFEVPLINKDINKEKESKIQLVLKQLDLDSNLLSPRNKNKLISTISNRLNFLISNKNYLEVMSLYTTIINKNNSNKTSIEKLINTFFNQVYYFNIINKNFYLNKYIASNQKLKFNNKKKRFESINKNLVLRKLNNINDSKVLSFTHNLINRGQILDLILQYLILNIKIDTLKLKIRAINLRNEDINSSPILENNSNINIKNISNYQPNVNNEIRSNGDLILVQDNNLILTPLKTLNILNTLNYFQNNNSLNNVQSNEGINSILLKVSKSQNNSNNSVLNSKNNSIIIPRNEVPNLNISDYKLYSKNINLEANNRKDNSPLLNNKESFIDLQLSNSFLGLGKTPNYFFKDNFIKLQETIKDLILESKKEFSPINDTVKNYPGLINSNMSILNYIKLITKQKDIKLNYSQIVGYKFQSEIHKMTKNIYDILASFFIAINCIISKPRFIISNDKIIIKLFFYNLKKKRVVKLINYQIS